jgi:caffeoyl-CoA O-methyltransferase
LSVHIVDSNVESYMRALLSSRDEPFLLEMENLAKERDFPIVNRHVGVTLEILARAIGASRVFELGSGYGYSAYWFAKAVGPKGEVQCTDGDPKNAKTAEGFLTRAGLWNRVKFHVSDAVTALNKTKGEYDIVYNDIDKHAYPEAWKAAKGRVRVGGFYICDNVLWSGRVADNSVNNDPRPTWTQAIKKHNEMISFDKEFLSSILPIRDGVMLAYRLK